MTIDQARHRISACLAANTQCDAGLLAQNKVFVCEHGPSGSQELLAMIHADDRYGDRFWYGHVCRYPQSENYVALLVWCHKLVNASNERLLFRRFHYWVQVDPHFEPCVVQRPDEAYAECASFQGAVDALAGMIKSFDADFLSGAYEGNSHQSQIEMRIFGVYGMEGLSSDQTHLDGPPFDPQLRLVDLGAG